MSEDLKHECARYNARLKCFDEACRRERKRIKDEWNRVKRGLRIEAPGPAGQLHETAALRPPEVR